VSDRLDCPLGDRLESALCKQAGGCLIHPDASVSFRPASYLSDHATSGRRRLKLAPSQQLATVQRPQLTFVIARPSGRLSRRLSL
jgi:hypothetical protein